MSTNWVRTAVLGTVACLTLVACDDNPVSENRDATTGLQVNPTFALVDAADTTRISAVGVNRYGEETRTGVTFSACDTKITVAPDPERVSVEAPDRVLVVGNTLGESCVTISGAGLSDQVDVAVVAAGLAVTAAPDVLRAGETGEVVVTTVDKAGAPVGPYTRSDATYESGDTATVKVTDDIGSVSTRVAGSAVVTATWESLGVTRSVAHTIVVEPNVPASAEFESADFGAALAVGDSAKLEVLVLDTFGNQNTFDTEILGVSAQTSDAGIATVRADLVPGTSVHVIVTAFAQGTGTASIAGTVNTTTGNYAFGPADVTVQ